MLDLLNSARSRAEKKIKENYPGYQRNIIDVFTTIQALLAYFPVGNYYSSCEKSKVPLLKYSIQFFIATAIKQHLLSNMTVNELIILINKGVIHRKALHLKSLQL